jgi:hypothetical protein
MPEITLSSNRSGMTPPLVTGTLTFAAKRSRYAEPNATLPPTVERTVTNGVLSAALVLEPLAPNLYWYASFREAGVVTWDEDIYIPTALTGSISFDDLQTAAPIVTIKDGIPIIQGPKGDPGPAGNGGGNGGNTVYTYSVNAVSLAKNVVTHSLGTTDVIVQVVTITTGEIVDTDIKITSANTVEVIFDTPPVANVYRIIVIGAGYTNEIGGPGTYSGSSYPGTTNRITHGLGSRDVIVQVNETGSGEVVEPDVTILNEDTIEVYFGTAVTQNQYRILVFGGSGGGGSTVGRQVAWGDISGNITSQLDLANRLEQLRAVLGDFYDSTTGQLQFSRKLEEIFPGSSYFTEISRLDKEVREVGAGYDTVDERFTAINASLQEFEDALTNNAGVSETFVTEGLEKKANADDVYSKTVADKNLKDAIGDISAAQATAALFGKVNGRG